MRDYETSTPRPWRVVPAWDHSDFDRCIRRDGSGRECRMEAGAVIHKTGHPNAEIRTAAHPFEERRASAYLVMSEEQERIGIGKAAETNNLSDAELIVAAVNAYDGHPYHRTGTALSMCPECRRGLSEEEEIP